MRSPNPRSLLALPVVLFACASSPASTSPGGSDDGAVHSGGDGSVTEEANSGGSGSSGGSSSGGSTGGASSGGPAGAEGGETPDATSLPHDAGHDASRDAGSAPGSLPYMIGIKTNSVSHGPATVQGWLGRPLDVAGTTITTTSYIGSNATHVNGSRSTPPLLEVSFPLLSIFGESNALNDLAKAAAGNYDATYEAMSQALAAWPNTLLSARIGWEFNGNWYAWSKGVGTNATYANYVSAFQHAAKAIRKYNPKALIQWCVAWGQPDPTPYWPGAYDAASNTGGVDVISMDFYQANISQYNNGGNRPTQAMAQSTGTTDLDWMTTYATQKGVKIALSEYGAGAP